MPGMKRDCGGAAGILGAFQAAVKMVSPKRKRATATTTTKTTTKQYQ